MLYKQDFATPLGVHPEDRTSNYNADDLRRWSKEIFDLEVKGK